MDFGLLPPEVNSGLMYAGPGSGPMLAAAAGWQAVAAELESAAAGYSSEVSGLAGQVWSGPSSLLMAGAAAPYVAWLHASAAQAGQTAAQAYGAAAAYEAAFAATVPPPVIAANRAQLAVLVATNFFGQNTPAIAATEAQYAAMWAQDAAAMYGYAGAAQTASTLKPFDQPPRTTNPAGQAAQARAVTQATGNATAARTQSVVQMASTNATRQLATTNAATQQGSTTTTAHTAGSVGTVTPVEPGQTVTAPPGSTVTLGPNSNMGLINGSATTGTPGAVLGSSDSIIVNPGSTVTVSYFPAMEGSNVIPIGGEVHAAASPIILTPYQGMDVVVQLVNGSATAFGGPVSGISSYQGITVTATIGSAGATITNAAGSVTITTATPVAPSTSGGLGAASAAAGLSSSPGLAGTSGIQPQLNAPLLAEWARGVVSGVDLTADLASAAG